MSRFTVLVFACLFSGSLLAEDKAEEKRMLRPMSM